MTTEINNMNFQLNAASIVRTLSKDKDFTDVTIVCEDGVKFHAHKVIVSAASSLFKNGLIHSQHHLPIIFLPFVTGPYFEHIINYIYCGETSIPDKDVDKFLKTARMLKLTDFLEKNVVMNAAEPNLDMLADVTNLMNAADSNLEMLPDLNSSFLDYLTNDAGAEQRPDLDRRIDDRLAAEELQNIQPTIIQTEPEELDEGDELQNVQPTLIQAEPEQLDSGKFKCVVCAYEANYKGDVQKHYNAIHIRIPHRCPHCEKSYLHKTALSRHVKAKHSK